jgi:hypothetical protein
MGKNHFYMFYVHVGKSSMLITIELEKIKFKWKFPDIVLIHVYENYLSDVIPNLHYTFHLYLLYISLPKSCVVVTKQNEMHIYWKNL